uniref:NAD(P)(+)--arginine ADP-ribosyltransferase n=1 Tax=Latimeria chalumnae TaxID=7897 RepID=H3AA91_LATCH
TRTPITLALLITTLALPALVQLRCKQTQNRSLNHAPIKLTMAPHSIDDQYLGCANAVNKIIATKTEEEKKANTKFGQTWNQAQILWRKQRKTTHLPPGMKEEHVIAVITYTLPGIYKEFNKDTREYGKSKDSLKSFPFKSLHFLLTQAINLLKKAENNVCHNVCRGTGAQFEAIKGQLVRFGQFTSTSNDTHVCNRFGKRTTFSIRTCYGSPVAQFSAFTTEFEVLIPPSEVFLVSKFMHSNEGNIIVLESAGHYSRLNCKLLKGK